MKYTETNLLFGLVKCIFHWTSDYQLSFLQQRESAGPLPDGDSTPVERLTKKLGNCPCTNYIDHIVDNRLS